MRVFIIIVGIFLILSILFFSHCKRKEANIKILKDSFRFLKRDINTLTVKNSNDLKKIPILYINLKKSTDRKKNIETQFGLFGIDIQRIEGIPFETIEKPWNDTQKKEYACCLSHVKAMNYAFERNWEKVIIVEDDVFIGLMHYWPITVSKFLKNLNDDWELVNLSNIHESVNIGKYPYIARGIRYGAIGYCVHRRGLEKIKKIRQEFLDHPIQSDLHLYNLFKPNAYYSTFPFFIPINDTFSMDSTIHKTHTYYHIQQSVNWLKALKSYNKDEDHRGHEPDFD